MPVWGRFGMYSRFFREFIVRDMILGDVVFIVILILGFVLLIGTPLNIAEV